MATLLAKAKRRLAHKLAHTLRRYAFYPYLYRSGWRALRSGAPRASAANYLTAFPHPGAGIGHQIANWVAGYHYAGVFGCRYAHAHFPDPRWEALLGFGAGEATVADASAGGYRPVRLPLFDEDDAAQLARTRRIVAAHGDAPALFLLESDQFLRDQSAAMAALKARFASGAARRATALRFDPARICIAVHVRRGDVSREAAQTNPNLRMRWQETDYFERVLERVLRALGDRAPAVYVFSQGGADDLAGFAAFPGVTFCLDMDAYATFVHLAAADVLIASKSGFSYAAALLGDGVCVVPEHFWHDFPADARFVRASDEADIDAERLAGALAGVRA